MEIAMIGAGRIGGNIARRLAQAGHSLSLSLARDAAALAALADELGAAVAVAPADAQAAADVVVVSVPWGTIPEALAQAGSLAGRIVIDTTNQFGSEPMPRAGTDGGRLQRRPHAGRALHEVVQHADLRLPGAGRRTAR